MFDDITPKQNDSRGAAPNAPKKGRAGAPPPHLPVQAQPAKSNGDEEDIFSDDLDLKEDGSVTPPKEIRKFKIPQPKEGYPEVFEKSQAGRQVFQNKRQDQGLYKSLYQTQDTAGAQSVPRDYDMPKQQSVAGVLDTVEQHGVQEVAGQQSEDSPKSELAKAGAEAISNNEQFSEQQPESARPQDIKVEEDMPEEQGLPSQEGAEDLQSALLQKFQSIPKVPIQPQIEHPYRIRKIIIFFLSQIVLVLIIVGIILAYKLLKSEPDEQPQSPDEIEEQEDADVNPPANTEPPAPQKPDEPAVPPSPPPKQEAVPLDTDKDGLPDEEELSLGINPRVPDTDFDGLGDFEEVKVYNTNPSMKDTDGDGFIDGVEVQNGFDPLKPGKTIK